MKKFFLLGILIPSLLNAQRLHLNLFGGISNYSGDLQSKRFTMDQSYGAFGAGLQYDLTNHFSILGNLTIAKVGASDVNNKPELKPRNLSFQTSIYEANILGEYTLFDLSRNRFSPYVFAGVAVYHFNPYTFDTLGHKVFLQPLSTEGEGLPQYPGQKPYKLTQLAIPFGGGIKLRISDNVVLAYEIGFRKLFTDYLDDVSTMYVDPAILLAAKGPKAVELSYRGNEIKGGNPNYPAVGTKRGSPKFYDWYYLSVIKISIGINSMGISNGKGGRGSVDCPKKVI
jgi:Outer membrane protein beta-barrel domain